MKLNSSSVSFGRHESFPLRFGWLTKGLTAVQNNPKVFERDDATITLGVGKNMVFCHPLLASGNSDYAVESREGPGAYTGRRGNICQQRGPLSGRRGNNLATPLAAGNQPYQSNCYLLVLQPLPQTGVHPRGSCIRVT